MKAMIREQQRMIAQLRKEKAKLRDALAAFAYLGRNELRPGDFNRARRVLAATEDSAESGRSE